MKRPLLVAALLAIALSACSKKDETPTPPPQTTASQPAETPSTATPGGAPADNQTPANEPVAPVESKPAN